MGDPGAPPRLDARCARSLLGAPRQARLTASTGWVAIINPRSRGGLSAADLDRLKGSLAGTVDDVLVSQHAGHVESLVRACRTATGILVGGGDGTLFEVLQGCDRDRQKLGVLPFGRGNSLARDLDLMSPERAAASVATGVDRPIDLLEVSWQTEDGRTWRGVSASNLALGYPAEVARRAAGLRWLGGASYLAGGLLAAPTWVNARGSATGRAASTETASGEAEWRFTGLIISNSRYVGPFLGFPAADLADGIFHTMELASGRVAQLAHNLSAVSGLRWYEPGAVQDVRALRLTLAEPTLVVIDGEIRDRVVDLTIAVLPKAATFRVPGGA